MSSSLFFYFGVKVNNAQCCALPEIRHIEKNIYRKGQSGKGFPLVLIMKTIIMILILLVPGCFLRSTWKNNYEIMEIGRDTIKVNSKDYHISAAYKQDKQADPKRIYLLFDFNDQILKMPFAIYEIKRDTLRLQKTIFEDVHVEDYEFIPFPKKFNDSQWVFIKDK